jgi:hypothetical protein
VTRKRDSLVTDVITVEPPPTLHCSHLGVRLEKVTIFCLIHRTQAFSEELGRWLAIAERIYAKSHSYKVAREFGRLVGSANLY